MEEIKTKICQCCGKELPITEFYKNSVTKDGFEPYCKTCKAESNKMCYEKRKQLRTQIKELQEQNEELRQRIIVNREKNLTLYDGRELLAELKRRGYVWQKMAVMQEVDYAKI